MVDATGLGQGPASFLERALGKGIVDSFVFTAQSKSRLGFDLLAAVNSGRLKMYAPDGSPEYVEFWEQMGQAEAYFRPNRTMNFHVDPKRGHDDYLASLALLVQASRYAPRVARGHSRNAAGNWRCPPCAETPPCHYPAPLGPQNDRGRIGIAVITRIVATNTGDGQ